MINEEDKKRYESYEKMVAERMEKHAATREAVERGARAFWATTGSDKEAAADQEEGYEAGARTLEDFIIYFRDDPHVPEPWQFRESFENGEPSGYVVQAGPAYPLFDCTSKADARRIVACVNACANFDTAALESLVPGSLFQHLKALVSYTRAEEEDYCSKREADEEETDSHIWTSIGPLARLVGEPLTEEVGRGAEK